MRLWYLPFSSILFFVVCCEAENKGIYEKSNKNSLLKFFKLNNGATKKGSVGSDHSSVDAKLNVSNKDRSSLSASLKCEQNFTTTFGKPYCTEKHKGNAVKKSFRPHDYDDDEDYDDPPGDYDDSPEDEEFSEEETRGSYRAFDDSPPRPRDPEEGRFRDYEREDDRERNPEFEFQDESLDRPGYEDAFDGERDGWDWEAPIHHHDRARWRSHHHPEYDDDDDYEPRYYPRFHHHPRRVHYHHNQYHHPAVDARTFGQARPSWPPYTQGYQSFTTTPAPVPYAPYSVGWTNSPAVQTNWQSPYFSSAALQSFNAIGPRVINPYLQNTFNSPQQQTNSFFVPSSSHLVQSSPAYLEATARNVVSFTRTLPGIAATLPRLSHDIFHYSRFNPLSGSRRNHFARQSSGPLPRHSEFPDAFLNRIREMNLH